MATVFSRISSVGSSMSGTMMVIMPAAGAARTPLWRVLQRQAVLGGTPRAAAAFRKGSGCGLPLWTVAAGDQGVEAVEQAVRPQVVVARRARLDEVAMARGRPTLVQSGRGSRPRRPSAACRRRATLRKRGATSARSGREIESRRRNAPAGHVSLCGAGSADHAAGRPRTAGRGRCRRRRLHQRVADQRLGVDQQAVHVEDDGVDGAGKAHGAD